MIRGNDESVLLVVCLAFLTMLALVSCGGGGSEIQSRPERAVPAGDAGGMQTVPERDIVTGRPTALQEPTGVGGVYVGIGHSRGYGRGWSARSGYWPGRSHGPPTGALPPRPSMPFNQ